MRGRPESPSAECTGRQIGDRLELSLSGTLNAVTLPSLIPVIRHWVTISGISTVVVNSSGVTECDGAGVAAMVSIRQEALKRNAEVVFTDLRDDLSNMLELYQLPRPETRKQRKRGVTGFVEDFGENFMEAVAGLREHVTFLGELMSGLVRSLLRPGSLRVKDFLMVAEMSGARALPIIAMLGFLVGLILAFQGAVLMAQFGAEIYIADFVGKSVARELGPLITAIIVAGRTGSAFAAEIGTMKVNEEIDAFTTMGLDPVRFLVIPRVLAATLMTPLLAVVTNVSGMAGGSIVMTGMGFPLVTYVNRVLEAVTTADYLGGLLKAFVFGFLISASGCLCGLRTGEGASAVGNAATRAVVSSIVLIVVADGIFAVVYFFLGI